MPTAADARELGENLRRLRLEAGLSLRDMQKATDPQAGKGVPNVRYLPRATIDRIEKGKLPNREQFSSYLIVCGVAVGSRQWRKWEPIWKKLAGESRPKVASRPVTEWSPFALDLHHAIRGETVDLPDLTPYLRREFDQELGDLLADVTSSMMIVLVGGSSTGKTRAALNALTEHLPDWPVQYPRTVTELVSMLTTGAIGKRTVLWLNELRIYLGGNEEPVVELRRLLADPDRGSLVVIGTMWPQTWRDLTAEPVSVQPDTYHHARELLLHATRRIRVPDRFNPQEVDELRCHADPRIAAAAAAAGRRGQVIQVLTGGPALVDRYEHPADEEDRYATAVVTGAMEVTRIGHLSLIPRVLLATSAAVYLGPTDRANPPAGWFDIGLSRAMAAVHGISALEELRDQPGIGQEDGYRLHDYLDQHARISRAAQPIAETIWRALVEHTADPDDRVRLARSAESRGLYHYAEALGGNAAHAGHGEAVWQLARLLERQERFAEAEKVWRRAIEVGLQGAWSGLAGLLEHLERLDEAELALRRAVDTGAPDAFMQDLADFFERHGRIAECEQVWRQAIDAGVPDARAQLAGKLDRWGREDEAAELWQADLAAGDLSAWGGLAWLAEKQGRLHDSMRQWKNAADAGHSGARRTLGDLFLEQRRPDITELLWRQWAAAGDGSAQWWLSDLLEQQGRVDEALELWDAKSSFDRWHVAGILERHGRLNEAEELWQQAITAQEPGSYANFAEFLDRQRRTTEAEMILRKGIIAGAPDALPGLIELLDKHGRAEEATRMRRHGINPDGPPTAQPQQP